MIDFFTSLLYPLELAVAWIVVTWHQLFTSIGLPADGGWTWVLSIVGLVLVIRSFLIPLFVKQIRSSREMQLIQPEIKKIQEKYKGKTDQESRQKLTKETMELYKTRKVNPFASCLPLLLQMPIFFALFNVLNGISRERSIGPLTEDLVAQANVATIFGAEISDTFLRADTIETRLIAIVLVVLMTASQFWSQRQLFMKNMPPAALDSPFAKQQKILMYVLPGVFAVSGIGFPLGVLFYWLVTNLFSTAQQFLVIRNMPAPGSPAERALEARQALKARRKAERRGGVAKAPETGRPNLVKPGLEPAPVEAPIPEIRQRQQPKRASRSQRKRS